MSEQWKADGKCEDCRRKDYCKTQCTANKKRIKAQFAQLIQQYMSEMKLKKEEEEVENDAESDQDQS